MHFFRILLGLLAALFVLFSETRSVLYADIADNGALHAPVDKLPFGVEGEDVLADGGDCSPLKGIAVARQQSRPKNPRLAEGRLHSAFAAEEQRTEQAVLLASAEVPARRRYRIPTVSRLL